MVRYCLECGAQLPSQARFCVSCGAAITGVDSAGAAARRESSVELSTAAMAPITPGPSPALTPEQLAAAAGMAGGAATAKIDTPFPAGDAGAATAKFDTAAAGGPAPTAKIAPPRPTYRGVSRDGVSQQFAAWPDDDDPWEAPEESAPQAPPTRRGGGARHEAAEPETGSRTAARRYADAQEMSGRRRGMVVPIVAGAAALCVLGIGAMVWTLNSGNGVPAPEPVPNPPSVAPAVPTTDKETSASGTEAKAQAARAAVLEALEAGKGSRTTLVQGIDTYCSKRDREGGSKLMTEALQGRMAQQAKLGEMGDTAFADLPGAKDARDKLKEALQASAEADQIYVRMARSGTVCHNSSELAQANSKASQAKQNFLRAWNPIMTANKKPEMKADDI
ncbi:hypothetical protein KEM60_01318 [Austwickia sp. TVS 96-490-7B]|uniref:zinc ribbon domain-containing protein n=1 Tax=Austwickia sp. TVS 96-490-7B TaxID=2830843 RepID=UPI001C598AD1|nr:zinc ribbon domain-containing protein [Austwickia sp. TVS 96-490-7B]MBW3085122.1 hypothetical protein [Austwickia sp. TVS 96-490-7B]